MGMDDSSSESDSEMAHVLVPKKEKKPKASPRMPPASRKVTPARERKLFGRVIGGGAKPTAKALKKVEPKGKITKPKATKPTAVTKATPKKSNDTKSRKPRSDKKPVKAVVDEDKKEKKMDKLKSMLSSLMNKQPAVQQEAAQPQTHEVPMDD